MADTSRPLVDRLAIELDEWEQALRPLRTLWDELWGQWTPTAPDQSQTAKERDKDNPWLSNVRIPQGFKAVETLVPRAVGTEPRMGYKALDDNRDSPVAAILGGLATWQMQLMGFEYETRNFVRQGFVTGYTVGKVGWYREEQDVVYTVPVKHFDDLLQAEFTIEEERQQRILTRNVPFFETVNVADFVFPLWAKDIDHASAVWQRRWVTKGYLLDLEDQGIYKNVSDPGKKLRDLLKDDDMGRFKSSRQTQYDQQNLEVRGSAEYVDDNDRIFELWERWTDDHLHTVVSPQTHKVLVRDDETPFRHHKKPYIDWSPIPHPFMLPGLGVIQIVYDLNEDLNSHRRQVRDAMTFSIMPAWKGTAGIGADQLQLFPGKYVEVEDTEDVQPLVLPAIDYAAAWRMEQEMKKDIQEVSGSFDYLSGGTGDVGTDQTATGVATITNEGNKRVAEMIKVLNERALVRFGHFMASMDAQYITEETAVDFSGDPNAKQAWDEFARVNKLEMTPDGKLANVTPEMIAAKGRLQPMPEIGQDKAVNEIQRRSDAVQLTTAIAPMAGSFDPAALTAYIMEQFGVKKADRDRILAGRPGASLPPELLSFIEQNPDLIQGITKLAKGEDPGAATANGSSGPSGDNLPTGDVVGAAGAAGPTGPPGMNQQ